MKYFDLDLPGINTARFLFGINGDFQIMFRQSDFNQYAFDLIYNPAGKREETIISDIPIEMVFDSYYYSCDEPQFEDNFREIMKGARLI